MKINTAEKREKLLENMGFKLNASFFYKTLEIQ